MRIKQRQVIPRPSSPDHWKPEKKGSITMNITAKYWAPKYGCNRTHDNLPVNLGETYFAAMELQGSETAISLQAHAKCSPRPAIFADMMSVVEFPDDCTTLAWSVTSDSVVVTVTKPNGLDAYRTLMKYVGLFSTPCRLVAGQYVVPAKNRLVEKALRWLFSRFKVDIVVRPV